MTLPSFCPVPHEQQPLNEYQDLQQSWFFGWAQRQGWSFWRPMLVIWGLGWLLAGPIAAVSFAPGRHRLLFMLSAAGGACVPLLLILIQLYGGWRYVRGRLFRPVVPYEESGWYDGYSWQKPPEVLTRDRLLVTYEIQPILRRLEQIFAGAGAFLSILIITVNFLRC
ncbi:MAG: CGLD27 family protein [Cyanobacteria bacterium P01_H01_bin.121]